MGLDEIDGPMLKKEIKFLLKYFDNSFTKQDKLNCHCAVVNLTKYFFQFLNGKTSDKGVLTYLKELLDTKEITEDEFLVNCILMLFSEQETTEFSIGNAFLSLKKNPQFIEEIKNGRVPVSSMSKEVFRTESATLYVHRSCLNEFERKGITIKTGDNIYLFLGAANRTLNSIKIQKYLILIVKTKKTGLLELEKTIA